MAEHIFPPDWARALIREPETLSFLEWEGGEARSPSGRLYQSEGGVIQFSDHKESYQNQQIWPVVNKENPSVRAFEERLIIFDRLAENLRGKILLDMCSGGGMPSYYLASRYGCRVISVERAWNAIRYYGDQFKKYYGMSDCQVVRVCGNASSLPIASNSVAVLVGSSWVHHFSDKTVILREAFRVLQDGGILIAHNEGLIGLLSRPTADEDQYTTVRQYRKSMQQAGFLDVEVVGCSRWYSLLRWVKGAVDLVGRKRLP